MMDLGWLNNLGIVLEIAGFVMILIAIRSAIQEKGFDFGLGKFMSLKHPWINYVGIGLVIGGLVGQLASNVSTVTLNSTFKIESLPTDVLQASVTLLVGFLIFFTLGWQFRLMDHILKQGEKGGSKVEARFSRNGFLLFLMALAAVVSAIFSLFESFLGFFPLRLFAVVSFAVSLISLTVLVYNILSNPPKRGEETNVSS